MNVFQIGNDEHMFVVREGIYNSNPGRKRKGWSDDVGSVFECIGFGVVNLREVRGLADTCGYKFNTLINVMTPATHSLL